MTSEQDRLDQDPAFDTVMQAICLEAVEEADFTDSTITSPAIRRLCRTVMLSLPAIEADLHARFPDEDTVEEALLAVLQISWDYGFRAGRIFHARGNEIPL